MADSLVRELNLPTLLVHPGEPAERAARHGQPAPVRHLLIALDGSPDAESMLPVAVQLGEAMGARFTLFRVIDSLPPLVYTPTGVVLPYPEEHLARPLCEAAVAYLERFAAPLRARGLDVQTRATAHPDPAAAILEAARTHGCDLIAMESHGRSGLARLVLGSVTGGVVHSGTTPVLTQAVGS